MIKTILYRALGFSLLSFTTSLTAQTTDSPNPEKAEQSPWLFAPVATSDPKVGTSAGFVAGYLTHFDKQSPVSTFGNASTYSETDSWYSVFFANTYFGEDKHRLFGLYIDGKLRNDFDDFANAGIPLQTSNTFDIYMLRYQYQLWENWFIGGQAAASDIGVSGDNAYSSIVAQLVGLTDTKAVGMGLAILYDTRDNQNSPATGTTFDINNFAYRQSFGGESSFDSYTVKYHRYTTIFDKHVLAARLSGRFSNNAETGGLSSLDLRGYVGGEYLAEHMTVAEVDGRFQINKTWGYSASAGMACLYNNTGDCGNYDNWYPSASVGLIYTIKPVDKIVLRAQYAVGKDNNDGFYLNVGHPF
ncbi:BamA/TamA family outer membrane protein [Oceanicoccus sagamiensis]|nr:BamA/TamA family outer membrane protein [Oceanicoccus sagamiensis]